MYEYLNAPCPICGGRACFASHNNGHGTHWIAIECEECHIKLLSEAFDDEANAREEIRDEAMERLVSRWNKRTSQPRRNIKTCPLCGSHAVIAYDADDVDDDGDAWMWIECPECGLSGVGGYGNASNIDYAIQQWNGECRHAEPSPSMRM